MFDFIHRHWQQEQDPLLKLVLVALQNHEISCNLLPSFPSNLSLSPLFHHLVPSRRSEALVFQYEVALPFEVSCIYMRGQLCSLCDLNRVLRH